MLIVYVDSCNSGHLWQSKETKQNCTGAENFDNWFCVNFDRYQKDLISGTKTGH